MIITRLSMAAIGATQEVLENKNENKIHIYTAHETRPCFSMWLRKINKFYMHNEYQLRNLRQRRAPQVQGILSSSNGNL